MPLKLHFPFHFFHYLRSNESTGLQYLSRKCLQLGAEPHSKCDADCHSGTWSIRKLGGSNRDTNCQCDDSVDPTNSKRGCSPGRQHHSASDGVHIAGSECYNNECYYNTFGLNPHSCNRYSGNDNFMTDWSFKCPYTQIFR